jgi:hypothetical protein
MEQYVLVAYALAALVLVAALVRAHSRVRIAKRVAIWTGETALLTICLATFLAAYYSHYHAQQPAARDVLIVAASVGLMFFSTGFLLSTATVRALWGNHRIWSYSMIAAALFLAHFEILNIAAGGAFDSRERMWVRLFGAFSAFLCTLSGSAALRSWSCEHQNS